MSPAAHVNGDRRLRDPLLASKYSIPCHVIRPCQNSYSWTSRRAPVSLKNENPLMHSMVPAIRPREVYSRDSDTAALVEDYCLRVH
jgi:hypothetical protein